MTEQTTTPKPGEAQPLEFAPKEVNRLTMVVRISYEQHGEEPHSVRSAVAQQILSPSEPYTRRLSVKDKTPIDFGWIDPDEAGWVVIENLEGKNQMVNPTEQEAEETANKVIEVHLSDTGSILVPPGQVQPFTTHNIQQVQISCEQGPARYRIHVFPK